MIDALIAGKVFGTPTRRTSKAGKPFSIAKVRAAAGDGDLIFVNVIAFDDVPAAAILMLNDGDAVSIAGSLTPRVWTDKDGNTRPAVDLVANQVLTVYHVNKKRKSTNPLPMPVNNQLPLDSEFDF